MREMICGLESKGLGGGGGGGGGGRRGAKVWLKVPCHKWLCCWLSVSTRPVWQCCIVLNGSVR